MRENAEASLAFYDKGVARKMETMFQTDRQRCKEISLAEWKHRGLTKRLSETVFWGCSSRITRPSPGLRSGSAT